jgi:hypothetical protein
MTELSKPNDIVSLVLKAKHPGVTGYAIPSLNHSDMKRLPDTINPKGTGIQGLTATLHRRTDQVAWYIRSDGYHEVFVIQTGLSFDKTNLMEYYPRNNDFGVTAWCIRDADKAARYYANLCLRPPVNERLSPERYKDTTGLKNRKIGRTQSNFKQCV